MGEADAEGREAAVDVDRLAGTEQGQGARQEIAVVPAENDRRPNRADLDAERGREVEHEPLSRVLGVLVGLTTRAGRDALVDGSLGGIAVNRDAGDQDEALHPGAGRRRQRRAGALHVDALELLTRTPVAHTGGRVHEGIRSPRRGVERARLGEVSLHE